MPHTDVIPTSASTASTGLGIRYVGQHCYAISGTVTTASGAGAATTALLDFTTGSGYIVATVAAQNDETGGGTTYFSVKFNGGKVIDARWDSSSSAGIILDFPFPLVIPPLTRVEVLCGVGSGTNVFTSQIVGRVYGAE